MVVKVSPLEPERVLELVHRVVDAYLKRKIESLLMRRRRVLRADPHYAYDSRFLPVGFQKLREG